MEEVIVFVYCAGFSGFSGEIEERDFFFKVNIYFVILWRIIADEEINGCKM
jgi:hypothetical protein